MVMSTQAFVRYYFKSKFDHAEMIIHRDLTIGFELWALKTAFLVFREGIYHQIKVLFELYVF